MVQSGDSKGQYRGTVYRNDAGLKAWLAKRPGEAALEPDLPWRQYIEPCIEAFGANRCMFKSNFPPDKQSCGYSELWNAFKRITGERSAAERTALYSGTAARVYRLTVP